MAQLRQQIIGHEHIKQRLMDPERQSVLAQAMIFAGESGVGKLKTAVAVAQTMVCTQGGCGQCGPCLRVEKRQSEAVLVVEPENEQIKVERTREIIRFLSLKSNTKIVIINDAHRLNPQASNALLKTLEEPPEDTFLILVTESPYGLLPTIRSRCQMVRFGRLSFAEMKLLFPNESDVVLRACQGLPARVACYSEEDWLALREKSFRFMLDSMKSQQRPEFRALSDSKTSALSTISLMQQFLRDWWQLSYGTKENLLHQDMSEKIQALPLNVSLFRYISSRLSESELLVSQNVDRGLLFENIAVQLRP